MYHTDLEKDEVDAKLASIKEARQVVVDERSRFLKEYPTYRYGNPLLYESDNIVGMLRIDSEYPMFRIFGEPVLFQEGCTLRASGRRS